MKHSIYTSEKGRLEILNHYEQYLNSFDFEKLKEALWIHPSEKHMY